MHWLLGSCIYCDMEQETILYYYPMPGQEDGSGRTAARRHWFQEARLQTRLLDERDGFGVLGCAVPPFYYRRKPWKPQALSEAMEAALYGAAGMPDTYVHPDIRRLLAREEHARWMPRQDTVRMLLRSLLKQYAGRALAGSGMVTVLLGRPEETDMQLETTWELLQPYLPRVNRMLLYYEKREMAGSDYDFGCSGEAPREETVGAEEPAGLREYLEACYYEYGLVPQLAPYNSARPMHAAERMTGLMQPAEQTDRERMWMQGPQSEISGGSGLHCGRERCGGVILDYCADFRYPKLIPADCVYIDVMSDGEKERIFRRKSLAIPYGSPLKYLDTVVKNSYDRKVKMT